MTINSDKNKIKEKYMLNLLNKNNYDKIGFDFKIMKKNSSKKIGIIFLIKSK